MSFWGDLCGKRQSVATSQCEYCGRPYVDLDAYYIHKVDCRKKTQEELDRQWAFKQWEKTSNPNEQ